MNRRSFLIQTGSTITATSTLFSLNTDASTPSNLQAIQGAWLSQQQWQTLAVVQEHLFPSESDAPGAKEIQATHYLNVMLTHPKSDPNERDLIKNGIVQLDKIAQDSYSKYFTLLSTEQREAVLRHLETEKIGKQWIRLLLEYIFEALLSDPIYGGNPNGIGWKWLAHQPGFPGLPKNKRYYLL